MKIALVGTAEFSRAIAPYDDESWEFWGCGHWNSAVRRYEMWFEMHKLDELQGCEKNCNLLTQSGRPVMVQKKDKLIPNGEVYPIKEMCLMFGARHFSSTPAYMMAFAIAKILVERQERGDNTLGRLGMWGMEMMGKGEYTLQRAGIEHFLDQCVFLKIPVTLPKGCDLRRMPKLYAYEGETGIERKHRELIEHSNSRIAQLEMEGQVINGKTGYHHGFIEAVTLLGEGRENGEYGKAPVGG